MVTCIDSAAAASTANQAQSAQLSVTRNEVNYNWDQVQYAAVDNGRIDETSMGSIKVTKNKKDEIKKVTLRLREVQEVGSSSTDDSNNAIDSSTYQDQGANIEATKDSANIKTNQLQLTSKESNGVIKQTQVTVIKVKLTKDGVKTTVKMKQKSKTK